MDAKKDALKKVIALMTVGQDVSKLFIDIINCMQQGDIEMKKLVYLYLINYADEKPDLALLAVQSFINVGYGLRAQWSYKCWFWQYRQQIGHSLYAIMNLISRMLPTRTLLFVLWPSVLWVAFTSSVFASI